MVTLKARAVLPGSCDARILLSAQPLSFWGGVDPATGRIIDHRHDRYGDSVAGRALALPGEKGSSTGSAVLLELIRNRCAPAAILTLEEAPVLALGAIIADELYDRSIPILKMDPGDWSTLTDGASVQVREKGAVRVLAPEDGGADEPER